MVQFNWPLTAGKLIRAHLGNLPSVFQEDDSVNLIDGITSQLMRLAEHIDLSIEESPAQQLDKSNVLWREQFPIPLDSDTGKNLLNNWLQSASSSSETLKKLRCKLQCLQTIDFDSLEIQAKLTLPEELEFAFTQEKATTNRFELNLYEGISKKANFGSVFGSFGTQSTVVKTRPKHTHIRRTDPTESFWLDISESGMTLDRLEVHDSPIPIGELPVSFILDDGEYSYIGQASVSHKNSTLYVLVPQDSKITILSGAVTELRQLQYKECPLIWYKVEGDVRINLDNNQYRICTNRSANTQGNLRLVGEEFEWPSKPSHVYKGFPRVATITGESAMNIGLTLLLDDQPLGQQQGHEIFGKHTLTVQNKEGDILMKRSIAVLPDDLSINFKALKQQASITVSSSCRFLSEITGRGLNVNASRQPGGREFLLTPDHLPPARVSLSVQANLEQLPIEVSLPYPASGIYAYDANGQTLARNVAIEQLLGSELYLYSCQDYAEEYRLEFQLARGCSDAPAFSTLVKVGYKPLVLSLYSFREKLEELLSLSAELDACVEIKAYFRGRERLITTIRRYSSSLDVDKSAQLVSLKSQGTVTYIPESEDTALAMRISEPERPPIPLPHKALGEIHLGYFGFATEMLKEAGWLIIPPKGSEHNFRPVFYSGKELGDLEREREAKSLQTAVQAFHPKRRPDSISQFLSGIEDNYSHPSWLYYRALWDNYGYLPLSAFEAWKALVCNPKALLTALFRLEFNAELIHRLDTEFPILWECIPWSHWKHCLKEYTDLLTSLGLNSAYIETYQKGLFEKIISSLPSIPKNILSSLLTSEDMQSLPAEVEQVFYQNSYQQLLRSNSEAEWPSNMPGPAFRVTLELPSLTGYLNVEHKHQLPVVIYPALSAAFATELLAPAQLTELSHSVKWHLKQLRNFDIEWFQAIFSLHLSRFSTQTQVELS